MVSVRDIMGKIDFSTLDSTRTGLNNLGLARNQIGPSFGHIFRASSPKALAFAKAIASQASDNTPVEGNSLELIKWAAGAGSEERRVVCTAFKQSKNNLFLVHGIGRLNSTEARSYMQDYFAAEGDLESVVRWLQIAGSALRKYGGAQPAEEFSIGGAFKWLGDKATDVVDAAASTATTLLNAVVSAGKSLASAIGEAASWAVGEIADLATALIKAGKKVTEILGAAMEQGTEVLKKFVKALMEIGRGVSEVLDWAVAKGAAAIRTVVKALLEVGRTIVVLVNEAVKKGLATVKLILKALLELGRSVTEVLKSIVSLAASVTRTVLQGLLAIGVRLVEVVVAICRDIGEGFHKGFFQGLLAIGKAALDILKAAAEAGVSILALAFAVFMEIWGGHRPLTADEKKEARRVFGWSIELDRVKIAVANIPSDVINWLNGQRPFTTMYVINFKSGANVDTKTLIHELTHVWQAATVGPIYMVQALHAQFLGAGYTYTEQDLIAKGGNFDAFNREQQASIIEDYWDRRYGPNPRDYKNWLPYAKKVYKGSKVTWTYGLRVPIAAGIHPGAAIN